MSFKDLNISSLTLTNLYKNSLVGIEEERKAAQKSIPKEEVVIPTDSIAPPKPPAMVKDPVTMVIPRYLGEHKRKISLLVRFENDMHISEAALEMLSKMLGACKLNLGDVAIINTSRQEVTIPDLRKTLAPQMVLMFGQDQKKLAMPFVFPDFKIQSHDQVTYLSAPDLGYLATSDPDEVKDLKFKLWNNLRTIFNV